MAIFVMLSKISLGHPEKVRALPQMDAEFDRRLQEECPEVKRIASYALLGDYDFLHIFEAPDAITAAKVALLANIYGVSHTTTLTAIPFEEFSRLTESF